jgi:uncharacterized protein YceH (UPF0502 family)
VIIGIVTGYRKAMAIIDIVKVVGKDRGMVPVLGDGSIHVSKVSPDYIEDITREFQLSPAETAALGVLLLRGPQTLGQIRGRTARMHPFADLAAVEETLRRLMERAAGPLVRLLPRIPGQKERRYAHMLSPVAAEEPSAEPALPVESPAPDAEQRIAALEAETERLGEEMEALRREFSRFREQFE